MNIQKTPIKDLIIIEPDVFGDARGFFMESYNDKRYAEAGIEGDFVQDNLSKSEKHVLRGLHFQDTPYTQGKLVQVISGSVYDVAVDLRPGSETFGTWFGVELSGENKKQFFVPAGFAHGFVTLEDDTLFSYKCTNYYAPDHDNGIIWNDSDLAIDWPIENPILSEKDTKHQTFREFKEK